MKAHPAKRKNLLLLAVIGAAAVGLLALLLSLVLPGRPKSQVDPQEIVLAVQRYSATHRPLPATVTFTQLIAEGYLGSNVLRNFGASEVTVYLNANPNSPQTFLMDALLPDGTHTTLLSDGSVQQFSNTRLPATNAAR